MADAHEKNAHISPIYLSNVHVPVVQEVNEESKVDVPFINYALWCVYQ